MHIEKKLIIFDFDGTLANTFHFGIEISNKLAKIFNYKIILSDNIEILRNKTSEEVLKESGIPFFKMPFIVFRFRKEYKKIRDLIQPIDGVEEMLNLLSKNNNLGIVTSNSKHTVEYFLEKHKILHLFNFIHAEASIFGKARILKKIIQKNSNEYQQVFYVGDETRDIQASRKCKLNSIAVTWGYNTKDILLKLKPDYIVDNPLEIIQIIEK